MNDSRSKPADPIGGEKEYRELFSKLKRFFEWNSCTAPEDLAQDTIRRGWQKLHSGSEIHTENPVSFFMGIARNIVREQRKSRKTEPLDDPDARPGPDPAGFGGLNATEMAILVEQRLRALPEADRRMLVDYMNGIRSSELTPEALRVKIHRLLRKLHEPEDMKQSRDSRH